MNTADSVNTAGDPLRVALEEVLSSQYDIVRLLGRGGMGSVYLARDRTLERVVAIKVLPPEVSNSGEALERFKREARTVAGLSHPNIVPLYAFGQAGQLGYFVMGYVRGESLADRMSREGKMEADEVRRILADIADALDYAHRQGIIHRDIKPDNILLDDATGRPMLTDFGIAKGQVQGQTLTQIGSVLGTPHYMSPEQCSGDREMDGRSDLYSLGVVGWAMLAGRVPFEGKNLHEILFHHVATEPPSVKTLAPDTPDELAEVVSRAMKKDPAQRWLDGKSMRLALGGDVGSGGESALPPELRELMSTGLMPIIMVYASFVMVCASLARGWHLGSLPAWFSLYPLIPGLLQPYIFVRPARAAGYDWAQIRRVVFWQPKWWPFWWPRSHRRPGDVTDRLPQTLRRIRVAFSVGIGLTLLVESLMLPLLGPLSETPRAHEPVAFTSGQLAWGATLAGDMLEWTVLSILLLGMGSMLMAMIFGTVWGKRKFGLGWQTSMRMIGAPSLAAFWSRAQVAPLLATGSTGSHRAEPSTPHELLRSLATVADQLTGPVRSAGSEALAAARELVAVVDRVDREIAELASSNDTAERARIEERLSAIDAQTIQTDERQQLRALLVNQLELMQRSQARHDAAVGHRQQLLGMLRALWVQVSGLTHPTPESPDEREVTGRLQTLCAEIRAQSALPSVTMVPVPGQTA